MASSLPLVTEFVLPVFRIIFWVIYSEVSGILVSVGQGELKVLLHHLPSQPSTFLPFDEVSLKVFLMKSGFPYLVVLSLSAWKDLSWLSYAISERMCIAVRNHLKPPLSSKKG